MIKIVKDILRIIVAVITSPIWLLIVLLFGLFGFANYFIGIFKYFFGTKYSLETKWDPVGIAGSNSSSPTGININNYMANPYSEFMPASNSTSNTTNNTTNNINNTTNNVVNNNNIDNSTANSTTNNSTVNNFYFQNGAPKDLNTSKDLVNSEEEPQAQEKPTFVVNPVETLDVTQEEKKLKDEDPRQIETNEPHQIEPDAPKQIESKEAHDDDSDDFDK